MALKQVNLSIPEMLYDEAQGYSEQFGYKNLQEFILDIMRTKLFKEEYIEYKAVEEDMKKGRNVKRFSQKEALNYLEGL